MKANNPITSNTFKKQTMRFTGNNLRMVINDLAISYNDEGPEEAPVIIFIHGFPFNKSMWNSQVKTLRDIYRTITYDVRGHGNSDAGNEPVSIELFAGDLIHIMDALQLQRAMVCGLSMGGYIALNAIENYPERFDALVLSDTQCISDTLEAKEKRIRAIESIWENGVEKYAEESIKNLFTYESFLTKRDKIDEIKDMITQTSRQSLCDTLLALSNRHETCSKLDGIDIPVLIMVGMEDKITPPVTARMIHEKTLNSSLYIIEHAGHLANIENPVEFNYQLKNFIHRFAKKSLPS